MNVNQFSPEILFPDKPDLLSGGIMLAVGITAAVFCELKTRELGWREKLGFPQAQKDLSEAALLGVMSYALLNTSDVNHNAILVGAGVAMGDLINRTFLKEHKVSASKPAAKPATPQQKTAAAKSSQSARR